ncbi:hypothetical protein Clacol_008998 [Clathrus columnatus]|uniref:Uncharacterized protein n=1 Tax=Clathrus columnatus TaxID=1419009 RepID=A0AAV5AJB1_9AGAM|nr:hypothetical protein Clacol_008998 [Clathrus columnatus]
MSIEIIVHHFTKSKDDLTPQVMQSARAIVQTSVLDSTVWRAAKRFTPYYYKPKANSFEWRCIPPKVHLQPPPCSLEDWDSSLPSLVPSFYLFRTDEFESTDFSKLFLIHKSTSYHQSTLSTSSIPFRRFAADLDTNLVTRVYKRARVTNVDDESNSNFSIFQTIPLPHYLEVPFPTRPPPKGIDQIPDFPIACCIIPLVRIHLPYSRAAWVIPLRGSVPVKGASAAQPCKTPIRSSSSAIIWNESALSQFWAFLLQQRVNNHFGPLSFAYIYASPSQKQKCNSELPGLLEYIKIYHDTRYALKFRTVLDCFRWTNRTFQRSPAPALERIFKGKKLVLVDETCQPILLA